jgi:uncharacterized membrane protein YfcA
VPTVTTIYIGVALGLLLGLTGVGSGSLLTPVLILQAGLSPSTAIGTALLASFTTKLYGSWSFYRRGMVDFGILREISWGCVPGTLAGAIAVRYVGVHRPEAFQHLLLRAIGVALVVVSVTMVMRLLPRKLREAGDPTLQLAHHHRKFVIIVLGFGIGFVFSLTSVGSGAALIPLMVLCYDRAKTSNMVATSIVMGALLAAIAGFAHAGLGDVDWRAVIGLVLGSIPAMWLSGHIHSRLPRQVPEGLIAAILMAMGVHIFSL